MPRGAEHIILRVLVGSQAHGLAGVESDADYRAVFVVPTVAMFRLDFKLPGPRWAKGGADETSWEVGSFLSLAVQCQPLVLETFMAPVVTMDEWGADLRALFPAVWSPTRAFDAFTGYAVNQRTKFLEKKDGRPAKYAATYIRTLYNLCELLEAGRFSMHIVDTAIGPTIARLREGKFHTGEVIDLAEHWTAEAVKRLDQCNHQPNIDAIDEFLIRLRKGFLRP